MSADDTDIELGNALVASTIAKRYKQITGDESAFHWTAIFQAGCEVLRMIDRAEGWEDVDAFFEFEEAIRDV
jgi:hypothetical protein